MKCERQTDQVQVLFSFFKKRTVRHSGHTWTEVETPAGRLPNKI